MVLGYLNIINYLFKDIINTTISIISNYFHSNYFHHIFFISPLKNNNESSLVIIFLIFALSGAISFFIDEKISETNKKYKHIIDDIKEFKNLKKNNINKKELLENLYKEINFLEMNKIKINENTIKNIPSYIKIKNIINRNKLYDIVAEEIIKYGNISNKSKNKINIEYSEIEEKNIQMQKEDKKEKIEIKQINNFINIKMTNNIMKEIYNDFDKKIEEENNNKIIEIYDLNSFNNLLKNMSNQFKENLKEKIENHNKMVSEKVRNNKNILKQENKDYFNINDYLINKEYDSEDELQKDITEKNLNLENKINELKIKLMLSNI